MYVMLKKMDKMYNNKIERHKIKMKFLGVVCLVFGHKKSLLENLQLSI